MKKIKANMFFIILLLFISSIDAQNFELVKNSDSIQVFNRKKEGSDLKEFKGITKIQTSLSSLVALMIDSSSFPRWMHLCSEAKVLKKSDFYSRTNYLINTAPWPVSNRDMIVFSHLTQDATTGKITIRLEGQKDFLPAKNGLVRVTKLEGFWQFTPLNNGEVEIIYQVFSEPGGRLPSVLANTTSIDIPYKTLKNMKKIILEEKFQNAKFKEIIEK